MCLSYVQCSTTQVGGLILIKFGVSVYFGHISGFIFINFFITENFVGVAAIRKNKQKYDLSKAVCTILPSIAYKDQNKSYWSPYFQRYWLGTYQ